VSSVSSLLAKLTGGRCRKANREQFRLVQNFVPTRDSLPTTPLELTSALYAAGSLKEGSVLNVEITKQIETPISHLWFLEVVYAAGSSPALPDRLLLKWAIEASPAPDRGEPELIFYRELAPSLPSPPMIRCFAIAAPDNREQWIILEDLRASHTNPPWPERPADKSVYDAIAVLARLHARWWESPSLGLTVGSLHTETALRTMVHGFRDHLPGFFADLGEDLPPADRRVLETVFNSSLRPWSRLLDERALTVIHGDAHTWNFLFSRSGDGMPYIFDWQLWHLDVGAKDLAFMIGLHWDRSTRQRLEMPLLQFYHEQLIAAGVDNYSFDDLVLDYRRCLVRNLTFPIILWSRGTSRESWRHRLDHALAAYRDLNAQELL
jgi:aminoglycoside phosphotransferase (APT) family kinase protein